MLSDLKLRQVKWLVDCKFASRKDSSVVQVARYFCVVKFRVYGKRKKPADFIWRQLQGKEPQI
jgi:hypothetical protein